MCAARGLNAITNSGHMEAVLSNTWLFCQDTVRCSGYLFLFWCGEAEELHREKWHKPIVLLL